MKKLFAVLMALTMIMSFSACGDDDTRSEMDEGKITTSLISSDEKTEDEDTDNSDDEVEEVEDSEKETDTDEESNEEVSSEEEEASDDGKKVEAMYSSKKDLKVNGHYILYKDGTWSYQSDSVSLMVTSEDDINDIEDRIDSGDLFEITEDDLNMVAAG